MKLEQDTKDSTTKVGLEFLPMGDGEQNIQATREKAPIVEISYIDFIFVDEQRIVRDCGWMVHVLQVKHPMVRLHINTNFCIKRSVAPSRPQVVEREREREREREIS